MIIKFMSEYIPFQMNPGLIWKGIWARRYQNIWLLAELVIVAYCSWSVLDPAIVFFHDKHFVPLGYDADRLCLVDLGTKDSEFPENYYASGQMWGDIVRVADKFRALEEVENVCIAEERSYFNGEGVADYNVGVYGDTQDFQNVHGLAFTRGTHFFETFGIHPVYGGLSQEDLSEGRFGADAVVVTRSLAMSLFGTEDAVGKIMAVRLGDDTLSARVAGVVENVRPFSFERYSNVFFRVLPDNISGRTSDAKLVLRLKDGVEPSKFVSDYRPRIYTEFGSGPFVARSVNSYSFVIDECERLMGLSSSYHQLLVAAAFFLFNLCVGVISTFWLQTRGRAGEIGIMRAFGATKVRVLLMLVSEAVMLATIGFVIGSFAYLQFTVDTGLSVGYNFTRTGHETDWLSVYHTHFLGVAAILYSIIVVVVCIGVLIPACRMVNVSPVDSLRNKD